MKARVQLRQPLAATALYGVRVGAELALGAGPFLIAEIWDGAPEVKRLRHLRFDRVGTSGEQVNRVRRRRPSASARHDGRQWS